MKKLIIALLVVGLFSFIATTAKAEGAGGVEFSGHVVTGMGYNHNTKNEAGACVLDSTGTVYYDGVLGKYQPAAPGPKEDRFMFFVDEIELDIAKSFGENIRLRADLDFSRINSSGYAATTLEQAYATANIPAGNGIELLIGRFNAPMGLESVDVSDNDTISYSALIGARPTSFTGAKLYYAFSDLVDMHFYVVNTVNSDTMVRMADLPGVGARIGFNWGAEGNESTLGISPFFGPSTGASNKHFTFGGDVDLNWWVTESFAVGAEGLFRRDNDRNSVANIVTFGGLLNLHYAFSDVWDGTFKYAFLNQRKSINALTQYAPFNQVAGAGRGKLHEVSLAGGYAVADGAKLKLEARFDMVDPVGASNTYYTYGGALAFAYDF